MKAQILLFSNERNSLNQIVQALEKDYNVLTTHTEGETMAIFQREKPEVAILDLSLDPETPKDLGGLRLLEQMREQEPSTRVIIVTAHPDDANALHAVRLGAFDYYSKPIILEEIKVIIKRAIHIHRWHKRLHTISPISAHGFPVINPGQGVNLKNAKRLMENQYIRKALSRNSGIISRAARDLGISRVNLYELIARHDIDRAEFKRVNPMTQSQNLKNQRTA
ncbi:MAG: response regulator [Candidatus Binatia bacterium]